MTELEELRKIKKIYGEKFMHLCRSLFPTLLESEGKLLEILSMTFSNNSETLFEDITKRGLEEELKNCVYSKIDVESPDKKIIEKKTPYELLEEAGYKLTECTSEKEIELFKKYYKPGEELCTFRGGRLYSCVVFFAVKKDVEDIKREDFNNPTREDKYGTSVMGIQFNKDGLCTVSIKNRYNHTVKNPDATYGNNLDRIIPGLTQSFAELLKQRGLELNISNIERFEFPGYVVAGDGKYYKYNMEMNGRYYCPGNIVIENGKAHQLENSQMLIDYFVVDTKEKTIKTYDGSLKDSFIDGLQDIEKMEIIKNKEKGNGIRTIIIYKNEHPITIEVDKNNQIVGYRNEELTQVGDNFLSGNIGLKELDLIKLEKAGDNFLQCNNNLERLELPKLGYIGSFALFANRILDNLKLPELIQLGEKFLAKNSSLKKIELPKLKKAEKEFLYQNIVIDEVKLPELIEVKDNFLAYCSRLKELELPKLELAGDNFLYYVNGLSRLELPKIRRVGDCFLESNMKLEKLKLPELRQAGRSFLAYTEGLEELEIPKLIEVGEDCFLGHKQGKRFYKTVIENKKRLKNNKTVNSGSIAYLDEKSELTTDEEKFGERIIIKIKNTVRDVFQNNKDPR